MIFSSISFLQDVQISHTQNALKKYFSHTVQIKDSQCAASYAILDFPVIFTQFGLSQGEGGSGAAGDGLE